MIPLAIDKQRKPEKGDLLLSEPFLMDNHFTRSVILMCEYASEGSFGLILNNTLDIHINDLMEGFPDLETIIGFGGPVEQNQLFFLHKTATLEGCEKISENCYLGGDFQNLLDKVGKGEQSANDVRFFVGYTGWGEGQLDQELKEKTWIVMKQPEQFDVFRTNDDSLWKDLITSLGGKYALMAAYPVNPADN